MIKKYGKFKIGDNVMELPDETGDSRWHGKIVGFSDCQYPGHSAPIRMLIVQFNGGYLKETMYVSHMVVHPANAILAGELNVDRVRDSSKLAVDNE